MNVLPLLCGLYDSAQQSRPYTFSYRNSGELHMHADIPRGRRDNVAAGWLEQRKVDVRKLLLDYVANHERVRAVAGDNVHGRVSLTVPPCLDRHLQWGMGSRYRILMLVHG